jgi:hypothetical protein
MTIFSDFGFPGSRTPLANARGFAFEQLVPSIASLRSALGDG